MYLIRDFCPRADIDMGRHGFSIVLHPQLRDHVAASRLTAEHIHGLIEVHARGWLDATGFDGWYDPDNYGMHRDPKKPPGPNATKSYQARDIRVSWGEWGPEHISVPGNACGLDIDHRALGNPFRRQTPILVPHNVDSWNQKNLLVMVFTHLVETVVLISDLEL